MKPLCVAFLWHMHQPLYKDPAASRYLMPWVRLHACKSYFDMVDVLEEFPDARLTFNLVPSLLVQIEDCGTGSATDPFLAHFLKPADSLTEPERRFLLQNFFMANWNSVIRRHGRYWQLLYKRGTNYTPGSDIEELKFTTRDYRDLQMWHNLAWFGFRARRKFPEIAELIAKGQHFTEEDKQTILALQVEIAHQVIPLYREARERGQIEITTSPFYHPIIPLVMSTANATRANPECTVPAERFEHPDDVRVQLEKALSLHRSVFGELPEGLWPPEGAVCPEMIPMIRKAGLKWMVSDEEVLEHSIPEDAARNRSEVLYKPYRVVHDGEAADMLFRDRELADAIGFHYMAMRPTDAVDNFMGQLQTIREGCEVAAKCYPGAPVVPVFLDGENPWEAYPNDGEGFLSELYRRLVADPSIRMTRISDYLSEFPPKDTLERLHPGSWINHNFNVWIGHPEENEAWDSLAGARAALEHTQAFAGAARAGKPNATDLEKAWEAIYVAEGSDWFWWYGDDFTSDNDAEFDNLFRTHLMNAYRFMGAEVPRVLAEPIKRYQTVAGAREPMRFIAPVIDGKRSNFYEWEGAGVYEARRPSGAMHQREAHIEQICYGFDLETLYLRVSYRNPAELGAFVDEKYRKQFRIVAELRHARDHLIEFVVDLDEVFKEGERPKIPRDEMITYRLARRTQDGKSVEELGIGDSLRTDKVTELSVSFEQLGFKAGDQVELAVTMYPIDRRGRAATIAPLERCPKKGNIHFTVPDEFFELDNWVV